MSDPVADAARAAVVILAPELGRDLPFEVEASLAVRAGARRPDSYLDVVSLGSLIVSVATLAWTIFNDQRARHKEQQQGQGPEADSIARQIRITLRDQDTVLPPDAERITEVVATEIIRYSNQPRSAD
jgi:hypothetical protein